MTYVPLRPGRPLPRETCCVCERPFARSAWVPADRVCRDCREAEQAARAAEAARQLRDNPPLF